MIIQSRGAEDEKGEKRNREVTGAGETKKRLEWTASRKKAKKENLRKIFLRASPT